MLEKNLLYILQIENYSPKFFLRYAYTHFNWWNLEKRGKLVWTTKAKAIHTVSLVLIFLFFIGSLFSFGYKGFFSLIFIILFLPFFILLALCVLSPLDYALKKKNTKLAKKIIEENKRNLTVIGITGSYGKTSTREILASVLGEKFRVLKLPDNINTDLGISDFIIKNKNNLKDADIFIVEMGAFKKGEIKKICDIVRPDYAILTGINESHLTKFGNMENIIKTKFELPEAAKETTVLNFNDKNIRGNYSRFKIKESIGVSSGDAQRLEFKNDFSGISFEVENVRFETKLLALHNVVLILLCLEIAKKLNMNLEEIKRGVEKIKIIPHRLEPIYNARTNIRVIDDSYNGNLNGFISGLEVLSNARGRKIVLTPGLVELGEKTEEIHKKIGELYAKKKLDLVLLIKNKVSDYIVYGMEKNNFKRYKIYNSTKEAHADLGNILMNGDTIIFQNDWPDNYF